MVEKTRILQIGLVDWETQLSDYHRQQLDWEFLSLEWGDESELSERFDFFIEKLHKGCFDVVLCTDELDNSVLWHFSKVMESYRVMIDQSFEGDVLETFKAEKRPFFMDMSNKGHVLDEICLYFYTEQRGGKEAVETIIVNDGFNGDWTLFGQHRMKISGHFPSEDVAPLLTWRRTSYTNGYSQKIWLEFTQSEGVSVSMTVVATSNDYKDGIRISHHDASEVKEGFEIKYEEPFIYLNFSLSVHGEGELEIGPLHHRNSHHRYGEFLLGGEKVFDDQNEELFYYFHPGDLKPPLNVYFSGFRSLEGFEGFWMMKNLGAPFLLITDPRLEGGAFYLGSPSLEAQLLGVIRQKLEDLGFGNNQLILSGFSMGTFGALYYGSFLSPHAVIVGKPLVNLGHMAANERLIRPGGFSTSLDLLRSLTGGLTEEAIDRLDRKFWDVFEQGEFDGTTFILSYMEDDDYDAQAYPQIVEALSDQSAVVIGKGTPGRHNDNWSGIFDWFISNYKRTLEEGFSRKEPSL